MLLNTKRLVNNLLRFYGYQIYRVPPEKRAGEHKAQLVEKQIGRFPVLFDSDNPILGIFNTCPLFSSELGRLTAAVHSKYPSLCVIDVGANLGDTAAIIKSYADVPIICIEGDRHSYALLERNTRSFREVTCIEAFLGEREEASKVVTEKRGWNTTLVPSKSEGCDISFVTLDSVLATNAAFKNCRLLKIDTEGFDSAIIRGAVNLIEQTKPVILFEYNRNCMGRISEDGLSTFKLLETMGYRAVMFYENTGWFMLATTLISHDLIQQLHEYCDGYNASVDYMDVCVFHTEDDDLAQRFITSEREFRLRHSVSGLKAIV